MITLKKISFGVTVWLLMSSVLALGPAWAIYQTFSGAEPLKSALRESGIYQTGVSEALKQSQKDNPEVKQGDIPTDRPEVQEVIKNSFPPQYLQTQAEKAIDATYAWVKGDTPTLNFKIDLGEAKTRLADGMTEYAQNRLNSLPTCTAGDLPANGGVDALSTPCVPPGTDKAALASKVRDEILKGEFLKDATVSADTIKDEQGRPLENQLQAGPAIYNTAKVSVYTMLIITILLAAGAVLLSPTWQQGLRRVGIVLLVTGAITGLFAWLTDAGMQKAAAEFLKNAQDNQALQEKVMKIVSLLVSDIRGHWITFSVVVIVTGAVALAVWHFVKPGAAETAQVLAHDMPDMKEEAGDSEQKTATPALPDMKMNYAKTPVKKKPGA